ncbi:MAG: hypothetical protein GX148_04915 [Clostridiales bacterium]|nr:hypothetical protein [Clostridiales bacterium]
MHPFCPGGGLHQKRSCQPACPPYNELAGKIWGIVGLGNIGGKVASVASAMGCKVVAYTRTPKEGYECTDIDTLCEISHR